MQEDPCEGFPKLEYILPAKKRIIVIGDLHGDLKLTLKCLKMAKIINDQGEWIAEPDTYVVQLGDQIDNCRPSSNVDCANKYSTQNDENSDIKILTFFTKLHHDAQQKDHGSGVISLIGNHELLNIDGTMTYVSYENLKEFKKKDEPSNGIDKLIQRRKKYFKRGSKEKEPGFGATLLACSRPLAVIIGNNLFVHASFMPKLAHKFNSREDFIELNILVKKWILGQLSEANDIEIDQNILHDFNISPVWNRNQGELPENLPAVDYRCEKAIDGVLSIYNINDIIIGHSPQLEINSTCGNRIWRTDIAMSNSFNQSEIKKKAQVLEITDDINFKIIKEI